MTELPPPEDPSNEPNEELISGPIDGPSDDTGDELAVSLGDYVEATQQDREPSSATAHDSPTDELQSDTSSSTDTPAAEFTERDLLDAAASGITTEEDSPQGATTPGAGPDDRPPPPGTPPPGYAPPPPGTPPPGYAPAPPVRRLYRSRHDRKLGGVSAGIAEHFRIDPTIVRLATLAFALSGVGILIYLVAWVIVPMRPDGWVEPHRNAPPMAERTMTVALGMAALALAFGIATGSWAVLALALLGGGFWLLSEQTATAPAPAAAGAGAGFEPMRYAATPPQGYTSPAQTTPMFTQPEQSRRPMPVKERKPQNVTWTVLSILALITAVGIAASTGDWWDVSAVRLLGIGIIVIGAGVVVGQLKGGGARGLIPLGLLAALVLFPVSAVDGLIDEGIGDTVYRPLTIAELESSYEFGIGEMTVDLSEIDFAGRSDSIDIDLGIGELIVIVSEDTGGSAVLQAKAGEISHQLPNTRNSFMYEDGINIETGTVRLQGDNGTVDLNINVGLGTAELRTRANS